MPQRVAYDPASHTLSINIPSTCLPLVAVVESINNDNLPIPSWQVVDTLPLPVSGLMPSYKEANLDLVDGHSGRSLVDEPIGVNDEIDPRVRVRFCLRTHHEHCGDYAEAERKYHLSNCQNSVYLTKIFCSWISFHQGSICPCNPHPHRHSGLLHRHHPLHRPATHVLQM